MSKLDQPSFGDDIISLFSPNDDVNTSDDEDELAYNEILAILYTVINCLNLFSNLWVILLICCSKLRRHFFYLKIVVCSVGDLIFMIVFSFEIMTLLDSNRAWKYSEQLCIFTRYIAETHMFFIALALCSLCSDRIMKICLNKRCCTITAQVMLFLLPFVGTYIVVIPVLVHYNIVMVTRLTNIEQVTFTYCKMSVDYDLKKIMAVNVLAILENAIFLPVLFVLLGIIICIYKKRLNSDVIIGTDQPHMCAHTNIDDDDDDDDADNAVDTDVTITSSGAAVIVVCVVTFVCALPDCVMYFCSPDCLPINIRKATIIQFSLYALSLVPSFMRPYLWLLDHDLRNTLKSAFCCCFYKGHELNG